MKLLELLAETEDGEYVVKNCLTEFSAKYSESLFKEILKFIHEKKQANTEHPNILRALSLCKTNIIKFKFNIIS